MITEKIKYKKGDTVVMEFTGGRLGIGYKDKAYIYTGYCGATKEYLEYALASSKQAYLFALICALRCGDLNEEVVQKTYTKEVLNEQV